jgi:hypothetical protein
MPAPFAPHVAPNVLVWTPVKYNYSALVAGAQGNAGDASDGFEATLALASRALAALPSASRSLDAAILDATNAAAAARAIPTDDITREIAAALATDTPALATLGAQIGALLYNPAAVQGLPPAPTVPGVTGAGVSSTGGGSPVSLGSAALPTIIAGTVVTTAAGAAAAGLITTATLATIATVVPIVGAVIAVGLLLLHFFGGGCGSPCIEGSRVEQIYEAASDNLLAVQKLGMISKNQAIYGMEQFMRAGVQHESQLGTDAARRGAANLQKVIQAEIVDAELQPLIQPRPLALDVARRHYVMTGDWYYESLQAAAQLTDTYLTNLPKV